MSERDPAIPELPTRTARAEWGDNQFCGYSVLRELSGKVGQWSLVSLAVGHRVLSPDEEKILDDLSACSLAADPRVWPLKIVRLAAAYGSAPHAFAAAHLTFEDARIGPWQAGDAARLLREVRAEAAQVGIDAAVARLLREKRKLAGFGVPFRERDERLIALERVMEGRGGPHWQTMRDLERIVSAQKPVQPNIVAGIAAVALDVGFAPEQIGAFTIMISAPQFLANAVEGAAQRPEVLQELPRELVRYAGPPPRESGRPRRR